MSVDVVQFASHVVVTNLGSEVIERVGHVESAVAPVVVVRAQCVVATSLYVERAQVQCHVVCQCKQSLRQLHVHHLARTSSLCR